MPVIYNLVPNKKLTDFGLILRNLYTNKGYNTKTFAEKVLHVSQTYVSQAETDPRKILTKRRIEEVIKKLHLKEREAEELRDARLKIRNPEAWEFKHIFPKRVPERHIETEEDYRVKIPVRLKVAANGTPGMAFSGDGYPIGETGEYIERPPGLSEKAYCAIVSGVSLWPGIPDGAKVIADPKSLIEWERIKRRDTVIAKLTNGLTYIKGYDIEGEWIHLCSSDSHPISKRKEDIQVLHKVLWVKMP